MLQRNNRSHPYATAALLRIARRFSEGDQGEAERLLDRGLALLAELPGRGAEPRSLLRPCAWPHAWRRTVPSRCAPRRLTRWKREVPPRYGAPRPRRSSRRLPEAAVARLRVPIPRRPRDHQLRERQRHAPRYSSAVGFEHGTVAPTARGSHSIRCCSCSGSIGVCCRKMRRATWSGHLVGIMRERPGRTAERRLRWAARDREVLVVPAFAALRGARAPETVRFRARERRDWRESGAQARR